MTKILYGGSAADFTVSTDTVDSIADVLLLEPSVNLVAYTAGADGAQITDLNLFTGDYVIPGGEAPSGVFSADSKGTFRVWAEDDLEFLFVAAQADPTVRWIVHPVNVQQRLAALEAGTPTNVGEAVAALKGVANGIAGLDADTKVPITQLPTGTTSTTVLKGDQQLEYKHLPPYTNVTQIWDGVGGAAATPNRITPRTDLIVIWRCPVEPSYAAGKAIAGLDEWRNTVPS
jgi:hypothetical protein